LGASVVRRTRAGFDDGVPPPVVHPERHLSHRGGWLRAAVLGANDGIVSVACLIIAVAAAGASHHAVVVAGVAALVAGALSMAIGEYTSVSSQRDAEQADIAKERKELAEMPERELRELTRIYIDKGLSPDLAHEVAVELSQGDVLAVHMAEELGLTHETLARPGQAAITSALAFTVGGLIPLLASALPWPSSALRVVVTAIAALIGLAVLGAAGAAAGGAPFGRPTVRMLVFGGAAMAAVAVIGKLLGVATG
jgi:VIT1/CCC1 family predicted Fe2+/Mn2+ transporter